MPSYSVPVTIEIQGSISVEADSQEEAIELAKAEYDRRYKDNMEGSTFGGLAVHVMDCPDIQVDFAYGDDPEAVECDEDEEDEG